MVYRFVPTVCSIVRRKSAGCAYQHTWHSLHPIFLEFINVRCKLHVNRAPDLCMRHLVANYIKYLVLPSFSKQQIVLMVCVTAASRSVMQLRTIDVHFA
jgi:hypothetical protein